MNTDAFKYKRPFSPDEETDELVKHWQTPDLTSERVRDTSRTNALNKAAPVAKAQQPAAEEELVVKPLTAEDIEQMRQAAYDEGFAQGKEDGFGKGYPEGREQGLQDGLSQGQAEGKKQGLADGQTELTERLGQLTQLLDQLQQPLASIDEQVQQHLLQLSLSMAQAVINVEVSTNPNVILQAIADATNALPLQSALLVIKLHPEDLALVQQAYGEDELNKRQWQLRAEPLLERGGCLVESNQSSVDRSLGQRLQSSLEHFIQLQQHSDSANKRIED
ncbi:flagellar assembly protein FliH [Rheinheimera maricola]|uniref:Flagellar assembly protein FliH n=1 Tax=Rheinheimera maricola TaxID=2793282 RepID=A0ABS7X3W0_9GAMM|nr:flagellar assembly protein FliH [Rheinheimera maricola]MBZ9610231.1 flagellar assembly protein FliH [Rheinheimera maricola]